MQVRLVRKKVKLIHYREQLSVTGRALAHNKQTKQYTQQQHEIILPIYVGSIKKNKNKQAFTVFYFQIDHSGFYTTISYIKLESLPAHEVKGY